MLAQDFTNALGLKRGLAGETLEQHDARGVQVGARGDFLIEQSRSLGRKVLCGPDPVVPNRCVQVGGASQAEIDERRLAQGCPFIHDHIGRFDIAVQHFVGVCGAQRAQQGTAQRNGLCDRKRTLPQTRLQRDSWNEGRDQIDSVVLGTVIEQGGEQSTLDFRKDVGFMLKSHPHRGGKRCCHRRLDHHLVAVSLIRGQQGFRITASLQCAQNLVPTANNSGFWQGLRFCGQRLRRGNGHTDVIPMAWKHPNESARVLKMQRNGHRLLQATIIAF